MQVVKTIVNSDPDMAMNDMIEWFYAQNEYEEGDMIVIVKPHEDAEVQFVVEEA